MNDFPTNIMLLFALMSLFLPVALVGAVLERYIDKKPWREIL